VIDIEVKKAMDRGFGRDYVGIERKRAQDFDELLNVFILSGYCNRDWKPSPLRIARAAGMRDSFGDFRGCEPVDVLARAAVHAHLELYGVEVNADGLRRFVADENFDGEDAYGEWIGLAEFFFRAGGVGVRVGDDREAFVAVFPGGCRGRWRWVGRFIRGWIGLSESGRGE